MPHLSSDDSQGKGFYGAMSPGAFVAAFLQIGDNEHSPDSPLSSQYAISNHHGSAHGRLVWDADHLRNGLTSSFFTVAPVRFHLKPDECLLSVGTADYLRTNIAPYRWIDKIQIGAIASSLTPARAITWDFLEFDFTDAAGHTTNRKACCLPRASTGIPMRRSLQASNPTRPQYPEQFAEFYTHSRQIVEIKIRGQVTLRANHLGPDLLHPLLAHELQGRIHIFTDADAQTAQ